MTDKLESPPTKKGNPLTEAQLVIAQLLGRLLAQRWRDENRSPPTPLSMDGNDDSKRIG